MLGEGLCHVPGAAHSLGEGGEVSRLDRDRLALRRSHGDPASDYVAGLRLPVRPGEPRHLASPRRPAADAHLGDVGLGGLAHDDGGHAQHERGREGEESEAEQGGLHRPHL